MLYGENVDSSGIGFVILHYMAEEMTICAVNNIIRLYPKSKIVIVDNGSTNKTGIFLKKYYLFSIPIPIYNFSNFIIITKLITISICHNRAKSFINIHFTIII